MKEKLNDYKVKLSKVNKNTVYIIIIIIGVLLLASFSFFPFEKSENKGNEDSEIKKHSQEDTITYLEERVTNILSQIEGVGDLSVMLTLDGSNQLSIAQEVKSTASSSMENGEENVSKESNQTSTENGIVIVRDQNGAEHPVVLSELNPEIKGVIVVAQGASKDEVKLKLFDAVKTVLGVPSYKVQVFNKK